MWTSDLFIPLMVDYSSWNMDSFTDPIGKTWNFKFMPKDYHKTEWALYYRSRCILEPYKRRFKDKVVHNKDLYLVMGVDEEDLLKLATGVT